MQYFVYILRTASNTLYTGITNNLEKRIDEHKNKSGKGAKYTRAFGALDVVYTEQLTSRSEALKREYEIKQLTRKQKEELLKSNSTIVQVAD